MAIFTRKCKNSKNAEVKKRPTMQIKNFPEVFEAQVVKAIIKGEKTGKNYVGGYFYINYINSEKHYCSYEIYFEDDEGKVFKTEGKSGALDNSELVPEARQELAEEKIITFEIPEPSQAERDVYGGNFSLQGALKDIFDIFTPKK